jgi:ribosomal protein L7/L12
MNYASQLMELTTAVLSANHVDQNVRMLALELRDGVMANQDGKITVNNIMLTPKQYYHFANLVKNEGKLPAIKVVRNSLGLTLREAKGVIDSIMERENF